MGESTITVMEEEIQDLQSLDNMDIDNENTTQVFFDSDLIDFGPGFLSAQNMPDVETESVDVFSLKECRSNLTAGLGLNNASQGASRFLNCLVEKGTANMKVEDGEKPNEAKSMATSIYAMKAVMLLLATSSILLIF